MSFDIIPILKTSSQIIYAYFRYRVKKMLIHIPLLNNIIHLNLIDAAKIFYIKTNKFPQKMAKQFHCIDEYNLDFIENYSIKTFQIEIEKNKGFLYGRNMITEEYEKIPFNEFKEMYLFKQDKKYNLFFTPDIRENNKAYDNISIKGKDLLNIIKIYRKIEIYPPIN